MTLSLYVNLIFAGKTVGLKRMRRMMSFCCFFVVVAVVGADVGDAVVVVAMQVVENVDAAVKDGDQIAARVGFEKAGRMRSVVVAASKEKMHRL